jgi:peptidoglycan/LPS O-acetylase OafA/YrhL
MHNWLTTPDYSVGSLLFQALQGALIWSAVILTLGVGDRFCNKNCTFLGYGSAASFSWYLVHFPLVVMAAYFVLPLHLHPALAFSLILGSSLLATVLTADVIFVRFPAMLKMFTQTRITLTEQRPITTSLRISTSNLSR